MRVGGDIGGTLWRRFMLLIPDVASLGKEPGVEMAAFLLWTVPFLVLLVFTLIYFFTGWPGGKGYSE